MPDRTTRKRKVEEATRATAPGPRPEPTRSTEAAKAFAVECARLLDGDKCEDVVILDLRGISTVCDYFVIATGTSDRQMRAAADHIEVMAKGLGEKPYGQGGYDEGAWIIVDFVDVVIHLFDQELRDYYDLESLWGDAGHIEWQSSQP